jgi:hypothetical protein
MGYINGAARNQTVLFPRTLDEYIDEHNVVRAIDAFKSIEKPERPR